MISHVTRVLPSAALLFNTLNGDGEFSTVAAYLSVSVPRVDRLAWFKGCRPPAPRYIHRMYRVNFSVTVL